MSGHCPGTRYVPEISVPALSQADNDPYTALRDRPIWLSASGLGGSTGSESTIVPRSCQPTSPIGGSGLPTMECNRTKSQTAADDPLHRDQHINERTAVGFVRG